MYCISPGFSVLRTRQKLGKDSVKNAPLSWFPKGYSLKTETLRKIAEEIHSRCHTAEIHVPAQAFDGQWHNIVVRSVTGSPLTVLQLQKDVWKDVEGTQKSIIIKELKSLNKQPNWTRIDGAIVASNGGIRLPKLVLSKHTEKSESESVEEEVIRESLPLSDIIPSRVLDNADTECSEVMAYTAIDD